MSDENKETKVHGTEGFTIKDSGHREEMDTGSKRDTQKGKPRPALIPSSFLVKLAMHYGNGADKYGPNNWRLGQPIMRYKESLDRHILAWSCGRTDEPHLLSAVWNIISIEWTLEQIKFGLLPPELDDRHEDMKEGNPIGEALYKMIEENVRLANEK